MRISRNLFWCSSLHLCPYWYSTQTHRLFDSLFLQAPITSSQCWASILLSSTDSRVTPYISFQGCGSFWRNCNIHFPVKYSGINGFGWQLISQVRGRKRAKWERQTWRDTFQALVVELKGWMEWTAGSVNGGPQLISAHFSSVARCLFFLSPNGCGSSVIIDQI